MLVDRAGAGRGPHQDRRRGQEDRRADRLDLPYFDIAEAAKRPPAEAGDWVLAFSNQFEIATRDEPMSVQRGVIAAYTKLHGRRGIFEPRTPATSTSSTPSPTTPAPAGGALIDRKGELLGIIGKELQNSLTDTWINYAIPSATAQGRTVTRTARTRKTMTVTHAEFVDEGDEGRVQADQAREDATGGRAATTASSSCRTSWSGRRRTSRTCVPGSPGGEGRAAAGRPDRLRRRRAGRQHQGVQRRA